jgi:SGNH hydrolase-like domain, acetyltransferase AlgX
MPEPEDPSIHAGAEPLDPPEPPARSNKAWRRRLGHAARIAAGLALGLGIAEATFHLRDRGAFPHLNVYVGDARLGLRLRPGASERILFGRNNPVTSVRINRDGLRGADLPPPAEGEILVVGDSQVFGLGVEEGETASADLAKILGGPAVINAGVPTYGPPEYNVVVEEMLARRKVGTVVYVLNFANDLFEASHPNPERHAVWDGWAVRRETAPESVTSFPGREILFGRSHLVYAIRSWLYRRGPAIDDRGFASEGTVADLVGVAASAGADRARAEQETRALREQRDQEIQDATAKELAAEIALEEVAIKTFAFGGPPGEAYRLSRDNPGDIVLTGRLPVPEESRGPPITATFLFNGAQVRRDMEERIRVFADLAARVEAGEPAGDLASPRAWVEAGHRGGFNANFALGSEVEKGRSHPLVRTLAEREALQKRFDALRAAPAEIVRAWSPMTPLLREVKAICDAHGARLLVVALPMDLQVSPAEWSKYGAQTPVDMEPTRILLEDVVASAEALGALGLDATPALAAAEPGAFLGGDIHMTPRGHEALAEAIARKLTGAR